MHIKCAIQSGSALACLVTRAPDQARKRITALTGAPARVLWIELPDQFVPSQEHLERIGSEFGTSVRVRTDHLGTVLLTRLRDPDDVAPGRVREVADAQATAMREEARRAVEIRRLKRRLAALGANNDAPDNALGAWAA